MVEWHNAISELCINDGVWDEHVEPCNCSDSTHICGICFEYVLKKDIFHRAIQGQYW